MNIKCINCLSSMKELIEKRKIHADHETKSFQCSSCYMMIEITLNPEERNKLNDITDKD